MLWLRRLQWVFWGAVGRGGSIYWLCMCKYLKIYFFQNEIGWLSVELHIKECCHLPLPGCSRSTFTEAVVSVVMSALGETENSVGRGFSDSVSKWYYALCASRVRRALKGSARMELFSQGFCTEIYLPVISESPCINI